MILKRLPLLLLVSLFACSDNHTIPEEVPVSRAIGFKAEAQSTRAGLIQGDDDVLSMGVYSSYSSTAYDASVDVYNNFMDNVHVSRTTASDPFTYSPTMFWPPVGNLSFFSYAPFSTSLQGVTIEESSPGGLGYPDLCYKISEQVSAHIDLLQGKEMDMSAELVIPTSVAIQFKHVLSCFDFTGTINNTTGSGTRATVSQIRLIGLCDSGRLSFESGASWSLGSSTNTLTMSTADGTLRNIVLSSAVQSLTSPTTAMMMPIPQNVDSNVILEITLSVVDTNGITSPIVYRSPLRTLISRLDMGKRYKIAISFGIGKVSLSYDVVPWDNKTVDIPPFE